MALGVPVQPAFGFHLADEDVQRRGQLRMAQLADAGTNFPQKCWNSFGPGRLGKEQQESQLRPARPNGILSLNRERDGPVKPRNRGFELAVFTIDSRQHEFTRAALRRRECPGPEQGVRQCSRLAVSAHLLQQIGLENVCVLAVGR